MGRKKKRPQEPISLSLSSSSLRSSSLRHDSPATSSNQVKTANVGCMSGIFQFMSKYHTRRKFLTFGKKQERNATVQAPSTPAQEKKPPQKPETVVTCQQPARDHPSTDGRPSLDQAPTRSPAIPLEIRRTSTDSIVSSPRVVARLMGLDEFPATPPPPSAAVSPAVEKRRKLLGALEKCDEDLKTLKKIIEAVRATQTPPRAAATETREEAEERESEVGSDEPSPVSVLDHHRLSSNYSKRAPYEQIIQQEQLHKPKQQKQHMTRKKPGDHEDKAINCLNKPSFSVLVTTIPQPLHLPARRSNQLLHNNAPTMYDSTPWSTAMKESVVEVCKDVEWGQKQEVGRIGLIIQDVIFRELIDEITRELSSCFRTYSTYKRKLSF